MKDISFSQDERDQLKAKIQRYFEDHLEQELGQFDAEFLLDFFSEALAPYYYNRGLMDAHAAFSSRMENAIDDIYALEKPLSR